MADLITPDQIMLLLGDENADEDVLQMYIDFSVGEIEAWLGRPISVQTFEEEYVPDVDGKIFVQNTPVVSITSVEVDGDVISSDLYSATVWGVEDFYYFNTFASYEFDLEDLDFPYERPAIVTYTAGLDTPMAVNSLIAEAVLRKYRERLVDIGKDADGTTGIDEIRVEDYAVKYGKGSATSAMYNGTGNSILMFRSENDFMPIKRYKRRSFA